MVERKKRIPRWLVPLVLVISLSGGVSLYSQFLADEPDPNANEEKPNIDEAKNSVAPDNIARNIKAELVPGASPSKCTIKVTWELNPKEKGEYIVAKSNQVIDTAEKVKAAKVVKAVNVTAMNTVIDNDCTPGSYYYVVLSKKSITDNKMDLRKDFNFLSAPVVIDPGIAFNIVSNIKAVETGKKIMLSWDRINRTALFYTVHRSKQVINSASILKQSEKLDTLADVGQYLDENATVDIPYFYAVTVKALKAKDNPNLFPDRNFTTTPVMVSSKKGDQIKVKTISARVDREAVMITWSHAGTDGDPNYQLFRSEKPIKNIMDIPGSAIIGIVNINTDKFLDSMAPSGKYYYGLIPGTGTDSSAYALIPGVNITSEPVVIVVKEVKKKEGQKKQEKIITQTDDIDLILKRTFFKGNYHGAIKELDGYIAASGSEQLKAKARLFIGRSNIELGRFRKALNYLLLPDVKKYYPKDASFWEEFTLVRLKNY